MVDALPLDDAVDGLAVDWVEARAPIGAATKKGKGKGKARLPTHILPVAEGSACRLVIEDGDVVLYHCLENDAAAHAADPHDGGGYCGGDDGDDHRHHHHNPGRLAFPYAVGPALEHALGTHSARPGRDAVAVADLPSPFGDRRDVEAAVGRLLEAGLVVAA